MDAPSDPAHPSRTDGQRGLAVFDLDGTITRHDTLLPWLVALLLRHPWRLPRLVMALPAIGGYLLGRGDRGGLKGAMIHAVLGGLPRERVAALTAGYVPRVLAHGLFAEAAQRIDWHRARGDRLLLMSASPDLYVPRIAAALGFDDCICTTVRWHADGRLDGRLASANRRGAEKTRCLRGYLATHPAAQVFAYGNSSADLDHMRLATEGWYVNGRSTDIPADAPQIRAVRWRRRGYATAPAT